MAAQCNPPDDPFGGDRSILRCRVGCTQSPMSRIFPTHEQPRRQETAFRPVATARYMQGAVRLILQ